MSPTRENDSSIWIPTPEVNALNPITPLRRMIPSQDTEMTHHQGIQGLNHNGQTTINTSLIKPLLGNNSTSVVPTPVSTLISGATSVQLTADAAINASAKKVEAPRKVHRKQLVHIGQLKEANQIARGLKQHYQASGRLVCFCLCHEIQLGKILAAAEWVGGIANPISGTDVSPTDEWQLWDAPEEALNLIVTKYTIWTQRGHHAPEVKQNVAKVLIDFAFSDVLLARYLPSMHTRGYLIFIFSFGCLAAWDCPEEYMTDLAALLQPALVKPYVDPEEDRDAAHMKAEEGDVYAEVLNVDRDDLNYVLPPGTLPRTNSTGSISEETNPENPLMVISPNDTKRDISGGRGSSEDEEHEENLYETLKAYSTKVKDMTQKRRIRIESKQIPPGSINADTIALVHPKDQYERLAYTYALAQSCKLTVFEDSIDNSLSITREYPETLAKTGRINASRKEISAKIGHLFTTRFYVNLYSDILDIPEFFWEHDEFENAYRTCRNYLDIPKRATILNSRLDIIKDLYDMLNQEILAVHGLQLEWIVIYLVLAEVLIEVVWNMLIRDTLGWVGHGV